MYSHPPKFHFVFCTFIRSRRELIVVAVHSILHKSESVIVLCAGPYWISKSSFVVLSRLFCNSRSASTRIYNHFIPPIDQYIRMYKKYWQLGSKVSLVNLSKWRFKRQTKLFVQISHGIVYFSTKVTLTDRNDRRLTPNYHSRGTYNSNPWKKWDKIYKS